jgi:hypothetical protein
VRVRVTAALVIISTLAASCAARRPVVVRPSVVGDKGVPDCPPNIERDLLSSNALQCWFTAPHGRWRTLGHQSHLDALVVEIEAEDLRDAETIARRVVASVAAAFSEVLVYVQAEPENRLVRVRRVQWSRNSGYETLNFTSPQVDSPLTVRSSP